VVVEKPEVSIILIVGKFRERAERALSTMLAQDGIHRAEVLLVDTCGKGVMPLKGSDHPCVKIIYEARPIHIGEMRANAIRETKGRIVAFLEEHSYLPDGWLTAVIEAFEFGWTGIGSEVLNANPGEGLSDLINILHYLNWIPPANPGETDIIPTHKTSYLRDVLLAYNDDLGDYLLIETLLMMRLRQDGYTLGIDPKVKIYHFSETDYYSLAQLGYLSHRCFGACRADLENWTTGMKVVRTLTSPLVPIVRSVRFYRSMRDRRPEDLHLFPRLIPVMMVYFGFSVVGLLAGWLFGLKNTPLELTRMELEGARGGA
jgi:hypothetical protein